MGNIVTFPAITGMFPLMDMEATFMNGTSVTQRTTKQNR
jgi:hypothetical protein